MKLMRQTISLPTRIETARMILRPYELEDSTAYFEMCRRNNQHLLPFEPRNPIRDVKSLEQAENLIRYFNMDWSAHVAFYYGGWTKETGKFAMQLYIGLIDTDLPEFEIGYLTDLHHEGQGYVTEAVRAALKMLFENMNAHRVKLACNELNERSWRVAERCGFVREGHLRQTRKTPLRPDGKYSGDYLYAILREEYF